MGWPGPMTARQYEAWEAWLELQWEIPSKLDYYLAQIACEASRATAKKPSSPKLNKYLIKFRVKKRKSGTGLTKEQTLAIAKARWIAIGGKKPEQRMEYRELQTASEREAEN
jgi:hypothetical protein